MQTLNRFESDLRVAVVAGLLAWPGLAAAQTAQFTIPSAGSGPTGIVAGPDGALWFDEQSANNIGRVTTSGSFTEFGIPTAGARPLSIIVGPDNALWFTELSAGKIGRITTAGRLPNIPCYRPARVPKRLQCRSG
jgi:streptogramin lyase